MNSGLVDRVVTDRTSLGEVLVINTARESMHVVVAVLLCFVKRLSSREYNVGSPEELRLEFFQFLRSELERAQLVHAIEDGAAGINMSREFLRHWGVIP